METPCWLNRWRLSPVEGQGVARYVCGTMTDHHTGLCQECRDRLLSGLSVPEREGIVEPAQERS